MSEQDQIRAEYLEISAHLHPNDDERAALESRRAALRVHCTHPNLGNGMLPGDFNQPVALNHCPDCGYISELVLWVTEAVALQSGCAAAGGAVSLPRAQVGK